MKNQQSQEPAGPENAPSVSVVIPVYNEEGSLESLHVKLTGQLEKLGRRYEIVFVDDGSTDRSFAILAGIQKSDPRVTVIRLRRNFGKSSALSAGFARTAGDLVFTMDADLQDDPGELGAFIEKFEQGYDLVSGWKHQRQDPLSKRLPSKLFNLVTGLVSGIRLHDFNCGFKLYRGNLARSLKIYGELYRYLPALAHWRGFRVTEIKVRHHRRAWGKSKFGSGRFVKGFLDLLTVVFLNRYIRRPLHLFGAVGTVFCLVGFSLGVYFVYYWLLYRNIGGRVPLLLFAVFMMLSGIQLISTGLIGEMLASGGQAESKAEDRVAEVLGQRAGTKG